jgi:hypothetical protein
LTRCHLLDGVSTVPAPISQPLVAATIAAMEVKGSGEFSGTSIRVIPAATSASAAGRPQPG